MREKCGKTLYKIGDYSNNYTIEEIHVYAEDEYFYYTESERTSFFAKVLVDSKDSSYRVYCSTYDEAKKHTMEALQEEIRNCRWETKKERLIKLMEEYSKGE